MTTRNWTKVRALLLKAEAGELTKSYVLSLDQDDQWHVVYLDSYGLIANSVDGVGEVADGYAVTDYGSFYLEKLRDEAVFTSAIANISEEFPEPAPILSGRFFSEIARIRQEN